MESAVIQSSADIRTDERDLSICFARVVLPAPGSPQMMNSVAWESNGSCLRKEQVKCALQEILIAHHRSSHLQESDPHAGQEQLGVGTEKSAVLVVQDAPPAESILAQKSQRIDRQG